jgi:hypothetical protein
MIKHNSFLEEISGKCCSLCSLLYCFSVDTLVPLLFW